MKYGKLTFLNVAGKSKDKHILWNMVCDCGQQDIFVASRVRNNNRIQCKPCSLKDIGKANTKHGMKKSSEYSSWCAMKKRCLNKNDKDYVRYGGNGINICAQWIDSFEAFYKDMGKKPFGFSIDRIDNTKGYTKENCKWSSRNEQQRNKSTSRVWVIKGIEFNSLGDAATYFKVQPQSVRRWVVGGFDKRRNTFTEARDDCKQIFKY